jgi:4-amino-4-deoxy-L-arabinose transferase-like glycosyltransferase
VSAPAARDAPRDPARRALIALGATLLVAAIALVFRLWRVATVPPGLYADEVHTARNALLWRLDPHAAWLGSRPLVFVGWVETSHLYLAFASAMLRLGGDGLLGARLVSAVPSLLAVPLLFLLGREVAGPRVGALAALLLAASHWAARSGRTGWDAVLLVTLQIAALACLAGALRRRHAGLAVLGGALLGLGLFTYVAARLAVLQAALWLAWEVWRARDAAERGGGRAVLRIALACLLVAAALGGPYLLHAALAQPGSLQERVRELSVFALHGQGEPWRTLARNVVAHAAMLHVRGGAYARDDLPGMPLLDPVSGLLFLVGLVALRRLAATPRRLLVSWPLVMVLGGVLSVSGEGPPYPYRVLALAPWACLVAALGGVALWDVARRRVPRAVLVAASVAALALVLTWNGWVLFVAGPRYPREERVFGTAPTVIGRWLRAQRRERPTLVLASALQWAPPPAARGAVAYARANAVDFFRPVDAAAAVQLVAGVWARDPARANDPLRTAGDVDIVDALPPRLARPTLLVLPVAGWRVAAQPYAVTDPWLLRSPAGAPLAVALLAR